MYTGHVAFALAVRGMRDELPLWTLILVSQACDWVEILAYPATRGANPDLYSHTFPFVLAGGIAAAAAVWVWKRSAGAATIALALYLSHPLLDFVTAIKPMWVNGPPVGFGLIKHPATDFVLQAAVCAVGFAVYRRSLPRAVRRQVANAAPFVLLLALQGISDLRLEWVKRRREHRAVTSLTPPVSIPR